MNYLLSVWTPPPAIANSQKYKLSIRNSSPSSHKYTDKRKVSLGGPATIKDHGGTKIKLKLTCRKAQ